MLVDRIPKRTMGKQEWANDQRPPPMHWMAVSQACINFVVKCPDPMRRAHCWKKWIAMLNAFSYTHEFLLTKHIVQMCPHNNVVAMLVDVLGRNCMSRNTELNRLKWTNDVIWSVWDRAALDSATDLFEVAEVYTSCMTTLRTCLMFESTKDVNMYGMWPSIGKGRLDCLQTFWNQVHANIEARSCDKKEVERELLEVQDQDGSGSSGSRTKQRLAARLEGMREEISRLCIMEHNTGMVMELIHGKKE